MASSEAVSPPRCMLFELSAELRNRIYEKVLVVPSWVSLRAATGLQVPALLQVCHQTRREAAQMYFMRNTFHFQLVKCNPELPHQWFNTAKRYVGSSGVDRIIDHVWIDYSCGDEDKKNVLKWCKLVREGALPELECDDERFREGSGTPIVVAGHQLAIEMRKRPWKKFVAVFDILWFAVDSSLARAGCWGLD